MLQRIKAFVRDSKAVSALEYAILVGIIAVAIATALGALSGDISTAITKIGEAVDDPTPSTINIP